MVHPTRTWMVHMQLQTSNADNEVEIINSNCYPPVNREEVAANDASKKRRLQSETSMGDIGENTTRQQSVKQKEGPGPDADLGLKLPLPAYLTLFGNPPMGYIVCGSEAVYVASIRQADRTDYVDVLKRVQYHIENGHRQVTKGEAMAFLAMLTRHPIDID